MRRIIFPPLLAAILALVSGAGQAPPQRLLQFTPQQQADLDRVNAYLDGIHTFKSNFVQLGPEGQLDQGTLYIEKPGRMRFSYQAPSPILIVATDGKLYVRNARLNTVDPYDLSDTPLGILLDNQVNLKSNKAILGVEEQSDALIVHARTSANRNQSNITLVFSFPAVELRQWMIKDNQGGTTTVALTGMQTGMALDDFFFRCPGESAVDQARRLMAPLVGIVCDFRRKQDMAEHRAGDEYVAAIRDGAGALPLLIPAGPLDAASLLARVDGLLFTGAELNVAPSSYGGAGPGTLLDPARDAVTLPLLRAAIAMAKPVLCICRGFQELNVALGGSLHQHLQEIPGRLDHREKPDVPADLAYAPAHPARFTPGGVLARITGRGEAMVNSLHQQGIDRLAPGLAVEAVAPDGQIEAVSGGPDFLLGVQWHPEWRWAEDAVSVAIFQAFGATLGH